MPVVTGKKVQGSQETQQKPPNDKKGDGLKSTEVNVVQKPVQDRTLNPRIQSRSLVSVFAAEEPCRACACHQPESAANTLLNTEFIHYYCWVFRRQDEQNQHQSPTDGTRGGQLQAYGALHTAGERTWNPLPPELQHFRYTGSRKIQLSELTARKSPCLVLPSREFRQDSGNTEHRGAIPHVAAVKKHIPAYVR